jgi:hypothetical protein
MRDRNARTDRKSHKQTYREVCYRTRASNRAYRDITAVMSDDNKIGGVIKALQNSRDNKRDCEHYHFFEERSLGHIDSLL